MKIGITGTREGMNIQQKIAVVDFLLENFSFGSEFHHGDCIGVDIEAAAMARAIGYAIHAHPGPGEALRGFSPADVYYEPKGHFARNRQIVDTCDVLVVVPLRDSHETRGGTWYTHDYAVKKGKPRHVVWRTLPAANFAAEYWDELAKAVDL